MSALPGSLKQGNERKPWRMLKLRKNQWQAKSQTESRDGYLKGGNLKHVPKVARIEIASEPDRVLLKLEDVGGLAGPHGN